MGPSCWLSVLFGAALLSGCAGHDRFDAVDDPGPRQAPDVALPSDEQGTEPPRVLARDEGTLSVTARSALQRRLGVVRFVVRDAAGDVVAGGEQEASSGRVDDLDLSFVLPAGRGLSLELSATATDVEGSRCVAAVGPFDVEAGSEASFQVLMWRCDGAPGAAAPEPECYWLADWIGVTRTTAAVGELIGVSAAGHDAVGDPARFSWSTTSPEQGRFTDAHAARTSFRCAAPHVAVPLSVALSDGQCQSQLTQLVTCR